jgi:hypothetical protein
MCHYHLAKCTCEQRVDLHSDLQASEMTQQTFQTIRVISFPQTYTNVDENTEHLQLLAQKRERVRLLLVKVSADYHKVRLMSCC